MITRRQNITIGAHFDTVGEPLVNIDANQIDDIRRLGLKYEYNLYWTAKRLYPQNPSAGFELLRFGRIISTEYETLIPAIAPLWRTVNFPGGSGLVNLASSDIKNSVMPTSRTGRAGEWWTMTWTITASVIPPLSRDYRRWEP